MTEMGPRRIGKGITTLQQAYSVTPMLPPVSATARQKCEFYREREAMFRDVAKTDAQRYWEAIACVGLEKEKADQVQQELQTATRQSSVRSPQ
ncbi:AMED_5909 family protein [Actinosynnema sp. ALI-1.44]|uniref:AMED_5909 family protein n=1 Tax=Actinosynnema sp. ALI-1.44 TaxID=1933779 RepID=UPI001178AE1D|nr:AMED_5909 family protein [Actinosynnema sp. ALI-1.44]